MILPKPMYIGGVASAEINWSKSVGGTQLLHPMVSKNQYPVIFISFLQSGGFGTTHWLSGTIKPKVHVEQNLTPKKPETIEKRYSSLHPQISSSYSYW